MHANSIPDTARNLSVHASYANHEAAISSLEKSVSLQETPRTLYQLAGLYVRAGRNMDAKRRLDRLLSIMPGHKKAQKLLEKISNDTGGGKK